ncbi:MAG: ribosomal protein S18-alanine N-acetyltransferase [bacterium]|nr:ribosomal protein S18-alanine N-acetyltransferase [bacterium]
MIKIKLEELKKEHIPSIMEIESVSFGKYHWTEKSFLTEIDNKLSNYYVYKDETGKVISYCGFWNILGEGHITTFAVREGYKRNKIAEQMMLYIIEKAKALDIKWFTLEVRASNLPAINFYTKYGFETSGIREKYYQDNNEDALIMWTPDIQSDKFNVLIANNRKNIEALN